MVHIWSFVPLYNVVMYTLHLYSYSGLSGKSQFLMGLVFSARYIDLFTNFVSPYNTLMKIFILSLSWSTVHLIYGKFKATYIHISDTFRVEFLIIPCAGLACLVNHDYSLVEVGCQTDVKYFPLPQENFIAIRLIC